MTKSVDELLKTTDVPVIGVDHYSMVTYVNPMFTDTYGWTIADLKNQLVTIIMPPYMRDAHNIGFSRFLETEESTIQGKPLSLPIMHKDGTKLNAHHYIVGKKRNGKWYFAASITLKTNT